MRHPTDIVHAAVVTRIAFLVLSVLLVLTLVGCATRTSFTEQLGNAYATVEATAVTVEELCAAETIGGECRGTLTTKQRDQARDALNEAVTLLDEARLTRSPENIAQARALLAIAIRITEERQ